jgi:hypothetical protein
MAALGLTCVIYSDGAKGLQLDVRQVLWIEVMHDIVEVSFLARRKKKEPLRLEKLNGRVDDTKLAQAWAESVLSAAYQGSISEADLDKVISDRAQE